MCIRDIYRRSRRFTVTLSQKQIVTLSSHTGLMQLSNRNRQQQLIQAAGMYRTNSDAAHTGYTTVCVCFFRMLYRDRLYRALCGALPTLHTRLICRRLQRNSVIGLIRMVSRYLQLTCRILFQMLPYLTGKYSKLLCIPVSYTHLDVYKRQFKDRWSNLLRIWLSIVMRSCCSCFPT